MVKRVGLLLGAFVLVTGLGAGSVDDRRVSLECTVKIGENVYRAKDKTVVWTENCSYDPNCEDAEVIFSDRTNGNIIRWNSGVSCQHINVAFR